LVDNFPTEDTKIWPSPSIKPAKYGPNCPLFELTGQILIE